MRLLVALVAVLTGSLVVPAQVQPPPALGHTLVYHAGLGQVVMFDTGLVPAADGSTVERPSRLWAWDGSTWTELGEPGPAPRMLAGVAYDAARDVIAVFGGTKGDRKTYYDDTWEWSVAAGWKRIDVQGPGIRHHTRMAYDAGLRQSVLFGGMNEREEFPADVWTWDGRVWQQHRADGPAGRAHHALEFDGLGVRLAGGVTESGKAGDVWQWKDGVWRQIAADADPFSHAVFLRDAAHGRMLLIGDRLGALLWEQRDAGWYPIDAPNAPAAQGMPGAALDERRGVLVLNRRTPGQGHATGETWELDEGVWTRRR